MRQNPNKLPKKTYDVDELFLSIGNPNELQLRRNQIERGEAAYHE